MVMQRHLSPFFNEEKHKAVVLTSLYCDPIEFLLEIIWVVRSLNTELIKRNVVHLLHKLLTARFSEGPIKEIDAVSRKFTLDTHLLHCGNERFH